MKLLFVIASVAVEGGGASKMLVWVANQFAMHGHEVTVYTHKPMNGPLFPINEKIRLVSTTKTTLNPLYPIPLIRAFMKKEKPDCVVSFMHDSNMYCVMAKSGMAIPVIVCERNDPFLATFWKLKIAERIERWADGAQFQLQQAADYYTWIHCPKAVIPNPILKSEYQVSKSFSERKNEICNYARFDMFQKRQDVLINAYAMVLKRHPEMTLVFYGDGKDLDKAKNLVRELHIKDKVDFRGMVKSPIQYCIDSKLFVLSSDFEGISNSLTEAMAAGMTVISTDTSPGGARLLIEDGVNGYVVARDNPTALSDMICYCLEHPSECDLVAKNACKVVDTFSEVHIYDLWEKFVSKVACK